MNPNPVPPLRPGHCPVPKSTRRSATTSSAKRHYARAGATHTAPRIMIVFVTLSPHEPQFLLARPLPRCLLCEAAISVVPNVVLVEVQASCG